MPRCSKVLLDISSEGNPLLPQTKLCGRKEACGKPPISFVTNGSPKNTSKKKLKKIFNISIQCLQNTGGSCSKLEAECRKSTRQHANASRGGMVRVHFFLMRQGNREHPRFTLWKSEHRENKHNIPKKIDQNFVSSEWPVLLCGIGSSSREKRTGPRNREYESAERKLEKYGFKRITKRPSPKRRERSGK